MPKPMTARGNTGRIGRRVVTIALLAMTSIPMTAPHPVAAQENTAAVPSPGAARTLRLMAGAEQEIRPGQPLERVAVGNPAVADALLLKARSGPPTVLVVARKPGVTDVMLWTRNAAPVTYTVQVDAVSPDAGGASVDLVTTGVFTLPKVSALALTVGQAVYWDDTAKNVTATTSGNTRIGVVTEVAANPSATVNVRLNGSF